MIQIYAPENTDFEMNGNDVLTPSVCTMEAELGGAWILNMTHPIDDEGKWKNIVKEAVISAPTFMGKKQLFRIDESDKRDTEVVVKAYPIFFDSADEVFILDKRPTDKTGQEALDILTEGTKYSGTSDITTVNTAYFIRRNLMDCLNGDSPSFIGTWGGEVLYDNYNVIVCECAGANKGAEVRYGKNMNGISFKEDMSQVVTRIVPVAYNGRTLTTNYVDSPLINNYAKVYTKEIKFEDVRYIEDLSESEDTGSIIVCNNQEELDAALIAKCNEQFTAGIDIFKVTIQIDMIALENTEEYKEFADIVKICLGDTVSCYNKRLNIAAEARAIKIEWNCITDSVEEVTLGDYETDFLEQWNSTISKVSKVLDSDGNIMAERVAGVLNAISTQLRYQKTLAQKQDVRAILFEDLDPDSQLYGAMCLGTQGFQIANKRLPDDSDWDWTTAFTANGGYANALITGILADKTGKNSWNLDTGELIIGGGTKLDGKSVEEILNAAEKAENAVVLVRVEYALGDTTDTAPVDGWSDVAPIWTEGKYMWQRTTTEYADGTTETTSPTCISGSTGQPGSDGNDGKDGTNGKDGADGVGVSSIQQYYLATTSSNGVTTSTSGWTTEVQVINVTKKYLWNYEEITYTDNTKTKTTPCIIGTYGDTGEKGDKGDDGDKGDKGDSGATGNGINSIAEKYAVSTSNTTAPTTWSDSVPTMTDINKYLWNYEIITYTNGTKAETTKRVIGVYGDKGTTGDDGSRGTGTYKVTTAPSSYTTATGGFTPTYRIALSTVKSQSGATEILVGDILEYSYYHYPVGYVDSSYVYLGSRTSIRGATGTAGADGQDGADGVGIESIVEQYYLSSSNTTQEGGDWSETCPTWSNGYYFWTRSHITWTDGTTSTTEPVLANGLNSANTNAKNAVTTANTAANRATYHYGTCATAAATVAKVVTLSGFSLYKGATVSVLFTYANTATNPTLNVNGTGAKAIRANGVNITKKFYWRAKNTVTFIYDGTYWVMSDTCANTILADWCDENDVTLINGRMLATHSVTANKMLVDDLMAFGATIGGWEITEDGLVKIGTAFILPTNEDWEMIKNASLGTVTLTDEQKKAADINGDGDINISEIVAWKSILLGKSTIDDYPNYTPVKSDIYIEINPNDAEKTIRLYGTNSFGTEVESCYGINLLRTQSVNAAAGRFGKLQAGEIATDAGVDLDELNSKFQNYQPIIKRMTFTATTDAWGQINLSLYIPLVDHVLSMMAHDTTLVLCQCYYVIRVYQGTGLDVYANKPVTMTVNYVD